MLDSITAVENIKRGTLESELALDVLKWMLPPEGLNSCFKIKLIPNGLYMHIPADNTSTANASQSKVGRMVALGLRRVISGP